MYTVRLWLVFRRILFGVAYLDNGSLVSRPLFIEEHGLRLFLEKEGVGVELSRMRYEGGDWADTIDEAWRRGRDKKAKKRVDGQSVDRQREMGELAKVVVRWAEEEHSRE